MSGFYVMQRGWRDHPVFAGEFSRGDAWGWLIENACWRETTVKIDGQYVELQRGELSFSVRFMADKWGWSKSRVDRFLKELNGLSMIETRSKIGTADAPKSGHGQAILIICNYAKYQDVTAGQRDSNGTGDGTAAGQQRDKEEPLNQLTSNKNKQGARDAEHPMPEDWRPAQFGPKTKSRSIVDGWPPGELEAQFEHFAAHHRKNGAKFKNWQDAWSTWVLNSRNFGGRHANNRQRSPQSPRSGDGMLNALRSLSGHQAGDPHAGDHR